MSQELGKHPELSEEEAAKLATAKMAENQPHDRLWYRINATRGLTGGNKLIPTLGEHMQDVRLCNIYLNLKLINLLVLQ